MISPRPILPAFVLATIVIALAPRVARAHAFPASESPRVGATINSAPAQVSITFDNPVEQTFARLQVLDRGGSQVATQAPTLLEDHKTLVTALKPIAPGEYTVKWSVVAEDGHRTEGSYAFTVQPEPH